MMPSCLYFEWPPSEAEILDATGDMAACPDCNTVHRIGLDCPRCWDRRLKAKTALAVARQMARERKARAEAEAQDAPEPDAEDSDSRPATWLAWALIVFAYVCLGVALWGAWR